MSIFVGIPLGPDPGIALVKERLSDVKYKVLILSGKGGVGKSTFSALLGRALAAKFPEKNVIMTILQTKISNVPDCSGSVLRSNSRNSCCL